MDLIEIAVNIPRTSRGILMIEWELSGIGIVTEICPPQEKE